MRPHFNPAAIKHLPALLLGLVKELVFFSKFIIILSLYSLQVILNSLASKRILKIVFKPISLPINKVIFKIINLVDPPPLSKSPLLIWLNWPMKNLELKKFELPLP